MHHQESKLLHIVDYKFLESVREVVAGLLVRAIPDIGHEGTSLELSPHTRVNTLRPSPVWLKHKKVMLQVWSHVHCELTWPKAFSSRIASVLTPSWEKTIQDKPKPRWQFPRESDTIILSMYSMERITMQQITTCYKRNIEHVQLTKTRKPTKLDD